MRKRLLHSLCLPMAITPVIAAAEVPSVAVDIPPVHSLVTRVMGDLGTPDLVMQAGASPHGYSMRSSEAKALADADVVVFVSDELTPWLERARGSLAADARSLELMASPGTLHLEYREGATFEAHNHGDDEHADHDEHAHEHEEDDHHDEHDHEAHAEDGHHDEHGDDEGHDEHGHDEHDEEGHEGHAHDGMDPHGWLDPVNAQAWLENIADALAESDPENAATYHQNAREGQQELGALTQSLKARLQQAQGTRFIVFHDAYQYFENRFGVPASGAISLGDASSPSPARVREIQQRVSEQNIQCVFREPQFNPALIDSVFEGTEVETSIVFEPLGVDLALGETLYPQLITRLSEGVLRCAGES